MIPAAIGYMTGESVDAAYLKDLEAISNGTFKTSRTGKNTTSVLGVVNRFDISNGKLPVLSSKEVVLRSIIHELIWMISGDTNIRYLKQNDVSIWDSWVDPKTIELSKSGDLMAGDIGPGYGKQWRNWEDYKVIHRLDENKVIDMESRGYSHYADLPSDMALYYRKIDQLSGIIEKLKHDPDNRRIIVSAWNVSDLDQMQLPPCHMTFQFYTTRLSREELIFALNQKSVDFPEDANYEECLVITENLRLPVYKLSCMVYQRSADFPLGVPFNFVQYALLTNLVAKSVNMLTHELVWVGADCHIYENQTDGVAKHLSRKGGVTDPYESVNPRVVIDETKSLFDYTADDIRVVDYHPLDRIYIPISV